MKTIPAHFRHRAIVAAASPLFLLPALNSKAAEPGPIGDEFEVSTVTADDQNNHPAIGLDANGSFVVAWESGSVGSRRIRAQRYSPAGVAEGDEFTVGNSTANADAHTPAVARDAYGDFVVAWVSTSGNTEIRAQRYSAAGVARGGEILVETSGNSIGQIPAIALDSDGNFVVVWDSFGSTFEIRAQRYSSAGVAQGGQITVNAAPLKHGLGFPSIALDADGDFVVAWINYVAITDVVRARRFSSTGVARGGEIKVSAVSTHSSPAIGVDADGDFVVAWKNYGYNSSGLTTEILARRYSSAGVAQGEAFRVNTIDPPLHADLSRAEIGLDANGDFAVAWAVPVYPLAGRAEIRARRYSSAGVAQGGEFEVNTATNISQSAVPTIGLDADGDFVVAWQGFRHSTHNNIRTDIRARRFQGSDSVDLSLLQSDSADPAPVNASLSYSLTANNLRSPAFTTGIPAIDGAIGTATGLRVEDRLPAGSRLLSASGTNWTCYQQNVLKVTCDYGVPLAAAASASPITVTLTPPNSPGVRIKNEGEASANQFDDNPDNNFDNEKTRLQ